MIDIPFDVKIPLCIQRGSVFNFYIEFEDSERQSKNRFFVVVNRKPKNDVILIMLTPTTKIENLKAFAVKSKISLKTIVEVKKGEHGIFTKNSAFNCNEVFSVKIDDLVKKIKESGTMNYPKIPENIIKSLIIGVKKSPRVLSETKDLL
ncbi:hypothetical protein ACFLZC_02150 [Patescibacteria group bacterium]